MIQLNIIWNLTLETLDLPEKFVNMPAITAKYCATASKLGVLEGLASSTEGMYTCALMSRGSSESRKGVGHA